MFVSSERWANEPCRVQTIGTLSEKLAEDGEEWVPEIEIWLGSRYTSFVLPLKMSSAELRAALATLGEVSAIGDAILINAGYIRSEVSNLDFEFEDAKQILLRSFHGLSYAI